MRACLAAKIIYSWGGRLSDGGKLVLLLLGLLLAPPALATEAWLLALQTNSGVSNGPTAETVFSVSAPTLIGKVMTYHFNGGRGATPGTIGLRNQSTGAMVGTWPAVGTYHSFDLTPGATWSATGDGPPYFYWNAQPNVTLQPGSYAVVDSDTATWATNYDVGNMGVTFVLGSAVTATTVGEEVGIAEIAAMVPSLSIPDGGYLDKRNSDPLGATGVDLSGALVTLSGDRLRAENIRIGDSAYWGDFVLRTDGGIAFIPVAAFAAGVPNQALATGTLDGIETTMAQSFLYGPPLQLAITPIGISGQYYSALFGFDTAGGFIFSGIEPTATPTLFRSNRTADPVADWIGKMSKIDATLPSNTDLGSALLDCGLALIGNASLPPALATTAHTVMQKMVANSQVLAQIKGAVADGDIGTASHLTASYLTTGLIETQTSREELGKLADALGVAAEVYGASCVGDYKGALEAAVKGALASYFPIGSCGLKVLIESARLANDYLNDARIARIYEHWRNSTIKDDWALYASLPEAASMIQTLGLKFYGDAAYSAEDRARLASAQLNKMLQAWDSQATTGGVRAEQLARAKTYYDGLDRDTKARLLGQVGETGTADERAVRAFVRYDQLLKIARRQLAPFRTLGVSDDQLDQAAADAASYVAASGDQTGYKSSIAGQIATWQRIAVRSATVRSGDGIPVPGFCPISTDDDSTTVPTVICANGTLPNCAWFQRGLYLYCASTATTAEYQYCQVDSSGN